MFNFLIKANHESESKKTELLLKNKDIIYALSSTSRIDYQALKILTKQNNLTEIKLSEIGDDLTNDQKEKAQEVIVPTILVRVASLAFMRREL